MCVNIHPTGLYEMGNITIGYVHEFVRTCKCLLLLYVFIINSTQVLIHKLHWIIEKRAALTHVPEENPTMATNK